MFLRSTPKAIMWWRKPDDTCLNCFGMRERSLLEQIDSMDTRSLGGHQARGKIAEENDVKLSN